MVGEERLLDDAEALQLAEEHEEHGQGHDDLAADGVDLLGTEDVAALLYLLGDVLTLYS